MPAKRTTRKNAPIEPTADAPNSPHDERFTARIPYAEKALLQRAAERRGQSLSAYVFEKARVAAISELEAAGEIVLAANDQRKFVELLLNPPRPNTRLRNAIKAAKALAADR